MVIDILIAIALTPICVGAGIAIVMLIMQLDPDGGYHQDQP